MLFSDRLMVSRLGDIHLAASMSGGITQVTVTAFFAGLVGYVNAIVAQYNGAGRLQRCAPTVFQALLVSVAAYPLMLFFTPFLRNLFVFAGHGQAQIELEYSYFSILMGGSIFVVLRAAFTGFFLGIGKTKIVLIANVTGMLVNLPANYVLIYGKLGIPALGLRGAAWGTIIGSALSVFIMICIYLGPAYRSLYATHKSFSWEPAIIKKLLRFGTPAGVEQILNVAAFTFFVEFMHSYGPGVAAAVTVAFNWDIVAFIPMVGMGAAVTAVVGHNIGAGDLARARRTARVALAVSWAYSGVMMILYIGFAPLLAGIILKGAPGGEAAMPLAVTMIRMMSVYTLADSVQLVFSGALRGAGDTRAVMLISVCLNWFFAAFAFILIRVLKADPVTVWIGYISCIVLWGLFMFLRYRFGRWQNIHLIE
jgi:MATE family multidrug resistance protein